jgi:hypothetical protein
MSIVTGSISSDGVNNIRQGQLICETTPEGYDEYIVYDNDEKELFTKYIHIDETHKKYIRICSGGNSRVEINQMKVDNKWINHGLTECFTNDVIYRRIMWDNGVAISTEDFDQ